MNKRSRIALFFLVIVGALLCALPLVVLPALATPAAGVLYASPVGLTSGACDSWANACELQTALGLAASGEEIWVQQGVYKPTSGSDRSAAFQLKSGVALYGGFTGAETAREQRDWDANLTILSGDIDGNDVNLDGNFVSEVYSDTVGGNSYHVVTGSGVDNTAALDGFTITAGLANGGFNDGNGGGMFSYAGAPALANIIFSGNWAGREGGGMANYNCSGLTLTQVIFTGNGSGFDGGGLYSKDCTAMQVTDAIFMDNIADNDGGGMKNYASAPLITRVVFKDNTARYGGGLFNGFNERGSPTLLDVVFSGNQANQGGGMMQYYFSSPQLTNVIFSGNDAAEGGGAIRNWNHSSPILTNVTFAGNTADTDGGAIYNGDGSNPRLQNVLAWNNENGNPGAAIFNSNDYDICNPTITFSLVEGCNPAGAWNSACGTDRGNNLTDGDPLFVAPQPASSAPTTAGDYRLQTASPAVNAGDNTADLDGVGAGTATISDLVMDLDGNPRINQAMVDLGAYEDQAFPCPAGGVVYVDDSATGPHTGESWSEAFAALQDALYVIQPCEIWVAQGVYYPDKDSNHTENDPSVTFQLKSGVPLYGGFAGTESAREQRDWESNITVLSGDIDGNDLTDPSGVVTNTVNIMGTNSYHVVTSSGVDSSAVLNGFTVTAGLAKGLSGCPWTPFGPACGGGGIFNSSGSPTLTNLTFSGNQADYGGGMHNHLSSPMITNVIFSSNQAGSGGGVYNSNGNPSLSNVTFRSNSAADNGGGMFSYQSSSILENVTFVSNSAGNYGGGMANFYDGNPLLTQVTFSGNWATSNGGGIYNVNSNPRLTNVVLSENQTGQLGGGMYNYHSSPTLTQVRFSGNQALHGGGGMYNYNYSNPGLMNVTFSGNLGFDGGGGMYSYYYSDPILTNVTFSENQGDSGAGMINVSNSPILKNSILWGNGTGASPQIANYSSNLTIYSSLVQDCNPGGVWNSVCGTDGGGNLPDADPLFVDAPSGDLRLSPSSPAIDAGNNAYITTTLDLAGGPRFVDIPASPDVGLGIAPLVDLGAYEANFVNVSLAKTVSPLQAKPGELITYTLTFSNGGSLLAAGVMITDVAPSFAFVQGVRVSGVTITNTGYTPPYVWGVQDLASGQGGAIQLIMALQAPLAVGVYTDTATITAQEDACAGDNHSGVGVQVLNVAPQAQGEGYTTLEDTSINVPAPGVLANDSDNNGDSLNAALNNNPSHGLLSLNSDGSFIYTPTLNYAGADSFTYRASDGELDSSPATVNLTITPVNDPPAGTNKTVTTPEDTPYTLGEADFGFRDPLDTPKDHFSRVKVVALPGKGTLSLDGLPVSADQFVTVTQVISGLLVFTPAADGNGDPYTSFTFQVEDDGGTGDGGVNLDPTPNTLAIQVTPVNDAPVAFEDSFIAYQDVPLMVNMPGLLANDVDVDTHKDSLSTILEGDPAHGVLTYFFPDGTFLYTPAADYFGPDSFTYYVTDGELNSNVVTVTITVYRRLFLPLVNR